jgi:hypothetical protein
MPRAVTPKTATCGLERLLIVAGFELVSRAGAGWFVIEIEQRSQVGYVGKRRRRMSLASDPAQNRLVLKVKGARMFRRDYVCD